GSSAVRRPQRANTAVVPPAARLRRAAHTREPKRESLRRPQKGTRATRACRSSVAESAESFPRTRLVGRAFVFAWDAGAGARHHVLLRALLQPLAATLARTQELLEAY